MHALRGAFRDLRTGLDGSYVADVDNPNNAFVLIFANCSLNYF